MAETMVGGQCAMVARTGPAHVVAPVIHTIDFTFTALMQMNLAGVTGGALMAQHGVIAQAKELAMCIPSPSGTVPTKIY